MGAAEAGASAGVSSARQLLELPVKNPGEFVSGNLPTAAFLRNGVSEVQPIVTAFIWRCIWCRPASRVADIRVWNQTWKFTMLLSFLPLSFLSPYLSSFFFERRTCRQAQARACPSKAVGCWVYVGQRVLLGILTRLHKLHSAGL